MDNRNLFSIDAMIERDRKRDRIDSIITVGTAIMVLLGLVIVAVSAIIYM